MLVCNVSLLRRRAAIAAAVAEITAAVDATATGNVVFATLVDDPASVGDRVDAYLGEIMLEAASAAATVNAGVTYAVAVVEAATPTAVVSASFYVPGVFAVTVVETAAANSAQDAELPTIVIARNAMVAGLEPISIGAMSGARRLRSGTMVVSSAVPTIYTASMFEPATATDRQTDGSNLFLNEHG
jgi:hypothetical protein